MHACTRVCLIVLTSPGYPPLHRRLHSLCYVGHSLALLDSHGPISNLTSRATSTRPPARTLAHQAQPRTPTHACSYGEAQGTVPTIPEGSRRRAYRGGEAIRPGYQNPQPDGPTSDAWHQESTSTRRKVRKLHSTSARTCQDPCLHGRRINQGLQTIGPISEA